MTGANLGVVYLVGAGPGDPALLTRRAAEILRRADTVFYDGLVDPRILELAPETAQRIPVGRQERLRLLDQEAVNRRLVDSAQSGRTVVRLKGGDPFVFGRGGEEAAALAAAGIPFEVVPGISSFHAVPACGGFRLAHGSTGNLSAFTVVSGREQPDKSEPSVDWAVIARTPGTKIVLMGMHALDRIANDLQSAGLAPTTPVAVIRRGTTPQQESLVGTLADIAHRAADARFEAPAIILVGDVAAPERRIEWSERRPLFGKRVVLTRSRNRVSQLAWRFAEFGADVIEIPVIAHEPPEDLAPFRDAVAHAASYDWLVFTSATGVDAFFSGFLETHGDLRALGQARLAAVGPSTADRLRRLRLRVDVVPNTFRAAAVAAAMHRLDNLRDRRILLARAQVANAELPGELTALGAIVDDVAVYRTTPVVAADDLHSRRLRTEGAEWVVFTSASTVERFHERFDLPALCRRHPCLALASIGPETSRALAALGLEPRVQPETFTLDALVAAIVDAVGR